MNIGLLAVRAAPHACRALRNIGLWPMTKQDLIDTLKNHPKAPEAIFWWCYCWHSGEGSDLYEIMCDDSLGYIPNWNDNVRDPISGIVSPRWRNDPEVIECIRWLDERFGPLVEHSYQPVKLAAVKEGQVLIAGSHFPCIIERWPCRVYRHHGALGVACTGSVHGVKLLPGSETTFHPLTEDTQGYVIGFRR